MTKVTRRYRFASSHRLHSPGLSEAENCTVYGKCNNPFGHGHNYVLDVTVSGRIQPENGRVISPGGLDDYVKQRVLDLFDQRDMNRDIAEFAGCVPTAENIAVVIRGMLLDGWAETFPAAALENIRIEETLRNSVELRNE